MSYDIANEETHDPECNCGACRHDPAWPSLLDLERVLADVISGVDPRDADFEVDVRLRVYDGSWYLHTGDASYDQDHRGFIGASSVAAGDTAETLRATAEDLIEQAREAQGR